MKRRDFLKILGVGITVPAIGIPTIASVNAKQSVTGSVANESVMGTVRMFGGVVEEESYYWLRVSLETGDAEWHNLMRTVLSDTDTAESAAKRLAGGTNNVLRDAGHMVRVSEKSVLEALTK